MIELNGETYLDGNEAAKLLGVKLSTLYAYVSRGMVKSYKQGIKRQRLYRRAEIEALLQVRPGDEETRRAKIPLAEDWISDK
jgi:citrate synthase